MPSQEPDWWTQAEPGIHDAVSGFTDWMREKISTIEPRKLIVKNPYLFCARAPVDADQLARRLIDAFLSSSEETKFGEILEKIAIAVCHAAKGGRKSGIEGIDLEYDEGSTRTIMQIKSSPNWGNSSQHKKLAENFRKATIVLRQGGIGQGVRSVEGICYGPTRHTDHLLHEKVVGNAFWHDICGWEDAGKAVLSIVGKHASNGMSNLVETAKTKMVTYLEENDAASSGTVHWNRLYDLIMMPTTKRPR